MLAIGAVLVVAESASAQFVGGFGARAQFSFRSRGARFSFQYREFYAGPALGFGWAPPIGPGFGPGFGNPFFLPPPPIVVGPPLIIPVGNAAAANPVFERRDEAPSTGFLVISPRKKEDGFIAPTVDRVAVPERAPAVRFDPFAAVKPVGRSEPADDANALKTAARDAILAGEYGAAVERLDRVLRLLPNDADAFYLKSQAQFAAGNYSEAVAAIRSGMAADAKWRDRPATAADLFGLPARFDGLMGDLKRTLAANPGSASLEFLVAHQLWFGGDRAVAKRGFENLVGRLRDDSAVKAFLR